MSRRGRDRITRWAGVVVAVIVLPDVAESSTVIVLPDVAGVVVTIDHVVVTTSCVYIEGPLVTVIMWW
ncbi:MAG: hypothetical protein H0A75_06760 [Candidatus Methanofishera endochildressiae]|uniref:Uncharacterized protein n=1 Tax=Candidatus Methanofishera endochildressiae TaxID=2738884 RepID=A0A7Z0MP66_9GAMM|nr:hypothetical protein [Candidatus Methanofishera endochildressiae]